MSDMIDAHLICAEYYDTEDSSNGMTKLIARKVLLACNQTVKIAGLFSSEIKSPIILFHTYGWAPGTPDLVKCEPCKKRMQELSVLLDSRN